MATIYRTLHADGHITSGTNRSTSVSNARRLGAVRVEKWSVEFVGSDRCVESQVAIVWRNPVDRTGLTYRADYWRAIDAEVQS